LGIPDQVAFADDAEQPLLVFDHRDPADVVITEQFCDFMD
jgi:hypothetical protein